MSSGRYSPSDDLDFRRDVDPNMLYELVSLLGEGSYGAVYSARTRDGSKPGDVAIKIIPDADDDLTSLWREIKFLQVLRSPFVVSFIESLLYDNELWLVMELCDGGSLFDLKEAVSSFTEAELQAIMAFSTIGLAHLHSQRSIHRDVKSGNILLTKDGKAKLGDFGISAQLTDTIMKRRTVIGSPYWMAPEVIQESSYDGKADIWSLGITLLELCEGNPPHFNVHPMRAIFIISSRPAPTLKEPSKWSPEMVDFVGRCLVKNCDQRATAAELLKHPWLRRTVKEIGPHANGMAILRDLVTDNWSEIERIRCSRLNIPVDGSDSSQNGQLSSENMTAHAMRELNSAAAALMLSQGGSTGGELESLGSERSLYDDATLRTVSRNSSFGGVVATRQQLRNRTLSRSNSRSTTPVSTPGKPMRGRLFNNAPGQSIAAQYSYDSNENASPKNGTNHSNGTGRDNGRSRTSTDERESKLHRDAKRDFKPVRLETPQRGGNWAKDIEMETEDAPLTSAVQNSSMVRSPPVTKSPEGEVPVPVAPPKTGGFMAALKYFQSEPIPPGAAAAGVGATPAAAAKSTGEADYKTPELKEGGVVPTSRVAVHHEQLSSSVVRTTRAISTATAEEVLKTETEVLIELTAPDDGSHNNLIRKEILKHLSALKQQYQDDLKSLTQAYESRRKILKDALLFYSSPASTGGSSLGGQYPSADVTGSERDGHDADAAKGSRHAGRSRNEEK